MKIKYLCPYWGSEDHQPNTFIKYVKNEEYDGIEINIPKDEVFETNFYIVLNEIRKEHPEFICGVQQVFGIKKETPQEYLDKVLKRLSEMVRFQPDFINSHTGKDYYSFSDNCKIIDAFEEFSIKSGIPVYHEIHRGRFTFHSLTTLRYLDVFLKRFLRKVFSSEKFDEIDQIDVEGMNLTNAEIYREWRNIDILIKLNNVVVCVENKVLSKEHSNQLTRYKEIVKNQFPEHKHTFVFLTPEGESSEDESDTYEPISYEFIVDSIERIISIYGESINEQVNYYIKDYIAIIKRQLMGTDKLAEL